MIHIGAALGAALSQGHSTTLGFTTAAFRRFRNPRDKRDFVTAGVAVGVATAFNAPIGGLLFAFEEVASFWQHSLGWQVWRCAVCCVVRHAVVATNLRKGECDHVSVKCLDERSNIGGDVRRTANPSLRLPLLLNILQIFFACMCATLTLNLSRSAGKAILHSGSFGWFNQVHMHVWVHAWMRFFSSLLPKQPSKHVENAIIKSKAFIF